MAGGSGRFLSESFTDQWGLMLAMTVPAGVVFLLGGVSEEPEHFSLGCGHVGGGGPDWAAAFLFFVFSFVLSCGFCLIVP